MVRRKASGSRGLTLGRLAISGTATLSSRTIDQPMLVFIKASCQVFGLPCSAPAFGPLQVIAQNSDRLHARSACLTWTYKLKETKDGHRNRQMVQPDQG